MVKYEVVSATYEHAAYVAANIREADAKELSYLAYNNAQLAIVRSMQYSDKCYTVLVDDTPCFLFGVCRPSLLSNCGLVWMLSTPDIYKIDFRRHELDLMRDYVLDLLDGYDAIENYVHVANQVSIRWLRFLGFNLDAPAEYGPYGKLFRHFEMRAESCAEH